jgi:hypothetical protein
MAVCADEKTSLRDGDWLRLHSCVVMNLGLLAVEAGSQPGSDVIGERVLVLLPNL